MPSKKKAQVKIEESDDEDYRKKRDRNNQVNRCSLPIVLKNTKKFSVQF